MDIFSLLEESDVYIFTVNEESDYYLSVHLFYLLIFVSYSQLINQIVYL